VTALARRLDSAHVLLAAGDGDHVEARGLRGRRHLDCADVRTADDWRGEDVTNRESAG
jgi:hypothetical protein